MNKSIWHDVGDFHIHTTAKDGVFATQGDVQCKYDVFYKIANYTCDGVGYITLVYIVSYLSTHGCKLEELVESVCKIVRLAETFNSLKLALEIYDTHNTHTH